VTSEPVSGPARGVIAIDQARCADVEFIAPLFDAYRQFYGKKTDLRAAEDFLRTRLVNGDGAVLIARVEQASASEPGAVVAFAQLYRSFSSVSLATIFVLNDLFVAPEWRSRGVGRRILAAAAEFAAHARAARIEIATRVTNHGARKLYESQGFVVDVEHTYLNLRLPCV
jgi:GNAT superfamily N-acetyltransferase